MTRGNPLTVILKFMIPLFIGNVFQQLYNMADTIIVGRFVGQNALAAVGSTGTIMFLVMGFSMGLTSGFTVLTSQKFGAKDADGVRVSVANAVLLSVIVVAVLTALSTSVMHPMLKLMNTPAEIYQDAYTYIMIICAGTAATVSYNLMSSFLRAVGNSRMPLISLIFSACVNVVLDLVFIIFFDMGVAGAAWATNISQALSALLCLAYVLKNVPELLPHKAQWHFHSWATAVQLRVGVPMALQFAITASGTMIMQAAINLYGAVAVAAITAAGKVQNVITQGDIAMGQSMATYAGQNYGKGDYERLTRGVRGSILVIAVYGIVAAFISVFLLKPMLSLFFAPGTDMTAMLPYAKKYIYLCAVFYIPLGLIFIFRNTMQGCGYGLLPMLGGVVELFCRMAVAAASMATMNFYLAAFCDPSAWIGAAIFTGIAYGIVMKKVRRTLHSDAASDAAS